MGNRESGVEKSEKHPRHPGRAAARSAAAQVRDLSHEVPCLQRTASRCAAHGMTGMVIKGDRHPGRAAARSAAAQVRDLSPEVPCLQRTASRCAAHGMTGMIVPFHPRHPGRAAACNDAAQVRDLSHRVPCLQRTAPARRCARDDGRGGNRDAGLGTARFDSRFPIHASRIPIAHRPSPVAAIMVNRAFTIYPLDP
jgi:hypothetical protein